MPNVRLLKRVGDLFIRGVRLTPQHIILDRHFKQHRRLGHNPELLGEEIGSVFTKWFPVKQNGSFLWVIEPLNEAQRRRLA